MLKVVSKKEALESVLQNACLPQRTQTLPCRECLSRVLAEDIMAAEDIPAFDRTVVDGFAVHAADTFGATEAIPAQLDIIGEVLMGEAADFTLPRGKCVKISTGGMLPQGADAAVMVEHTDCENELCLIYKSVSPSENVSKKADDIAKGALVIPKGTVITAAHIGIFAALGIETVKVFAKPRIAVISTGDEISRNPAPGQIRDVNSYLLEAAATAAGCEVRCYGAVKDDRALITAALKDCLQEADIVLISGGSSAGARDMTVEIIDTLGEVFFHGIAMKPGKPSIFGTVESRAVFGLPGHPLAAFFVFRQIVCPLIRQMLAQPPEKALCKATLSQNIPSNHGREESLCVKRLKDGTVLPLHTKSGMISVLSEADGFITVSRDAEGLRAGETVEVFSLI